MHFFVTYKSFLFSLVVKLTCLLLLCTISLSASFAQTNVTTQHNNLKRTGWNDTETQLTQNNISGGSFGKIFTRQVDDQIYAQPLVLSNVSIGGGTHNIVLIATVNNSVYAFDADNAAATSPYWHADLTFDPANYRPIKNSDMTGAGGGNYTDFSGNMGIVGTPVIDPVSKTLYVVSRSVTKTGATFVQYLHALDITTGAEKANSPKYITATVNGVGSGNVGGVLVFNQQTHNQRPGLLLYNGNVYICWASHGDWTPYHGWVLGYDAVSLNQTYVYNATQNGGEGGIWMSGQAPAVDDNGFIYVVTGNGTTGRSGNVNDSTNRGESIIKLSTASGTLKPVDFYTPYDYNYLNQTDLDFGSDGAMLIPNSNLSLSGSKESYLYLIDDNNMGGTTADNSNAKQLLNINASSASYLKHLHGSPVYFKDQNGQEYIYAWAEGGLLKQFPFNRGTMLFDTLNKIVGNTALPDGMPGAMLSLSSNGSQTSSGILWASHPINGNANHSVVPGILQAFAADDVTHELWNSNWSSLRDSVGRFAKYVPPTVANGKVYLATFSNVLNVYGLNAPSVSACSGTLPAPWQSEDIGYVPLAGDVCYNNGTFTITASGGDINNTADAFHYVSQLAATNSIDIKARVKSLQYTHPFAKCGIMFRSNLDAGSANVFMAITPGNGAAFQTRTSQSDTTSPAYTAGFSAPYWVRVINNGNKYVGYISPDGAAWTAIDSVTIALGAHPYFGFAYTSHSNPTLGTAVIDNVSVDQSGVLPLELISFSAKNIENKYSGLTWKTAHEQNVDHFEIESSTSATDFKSIGSVKSIGSSSANENNYSFNDVHPANGVNFYRLKLVDINGHAGYSAIVPVSFNFKVLDIFPNPAHGHIYISNNNYFTNGAALSIQLSDIKGQVVYKQASASSGNNVITINIPSKLPTGMYVITITNNTGEKQSRKVYINN